MLWLARTVGPLVHHGSIDQALKIIQVERMINEIAWMEEVSVVTRQDFRSMNKRGPGRGMVMEYGCDRGYPPSTPMAYRGCVSDNTLSNPDRNLGRVSSCVPGIRHRTSWRNLECLDTSPFRFPFPARE